MRKPISRSTTSIVQQMNCYSTRQMFLDFYSGKKIDLPSGVDQRSFDFDDHAKVDFEAELLQDSPNLIEQHFMREKFMEHLHPEEAHLASGEQSVSDVTSDQKFTGELLDDVSSTA